MMKKIYLLLLIISVVFISGCVSDPTSLARGLPEVQRFLNQYPNAEISATQLDKSYVETIIGDIRKDCDNPSLEAKAYWRVKFNDPDTDMRAIVWIDPDTQQPACILKEGTGTKMVDCGSNAACWGKNYKECKPAKVYQRTEFKGKEQKTYFEIRGKKDGNCVFYAKLEKFDPKPEFEGSEMTCKTPIGSTNIDWHTDCTGPMVDFLKWEENQTGMVITNETENFESCCGHYVASGCVRDPSEFYCYDKVTLKDVAAKISISEDKIKSMCGCPSREVTCPSRIEVNYDKNVYNNNDRITMEIKALDENNNIIPYTVFNESKFINGVRISSTDKMDTGSSGIYEATGILNVNNYPIGKTETVVFVTQDGCEPVSGSDSFEFNPPVICGDGSCDEVTSYLKRGDHIDISLNNETYMIELRELGSESAVFRVSSREGTVMKILDKGFSSWVGGIKINLIDVDEDEEVAYFKIIETCPQDCEENQTVSCTDSDGGKNYYEKGTTSATGVTKTDYCYGRGAVYVGVREFYCEGNKIKSVYYDCPYTPASGDPCEDGACVKEGLTQLTSDTVDEVTPDWSSDNKIVYQKNEGTYTSGYPNNIWVMNSDGTNQHALTHSTGYDSNRQPKWSVDGERTMHKITFWAYRPFGQGGSIWTMDSDGSNQKKIYVKSGYDSDKPVSSPDGTKIAFTSSSRYGGGPRELYMMNSDGSNIHKILNALGNKNDGMSKSGGSISYSFDGKWLAFESERSGNWDIWIVKPDGSGLTQLTTKSSKDFYPAWSPDGEQIAFVSDRSGNEDIWILENVQEVIEGAEPIYSQLTKNSNNDLSPSWSPNGKKIAFASNRSGNYDIWTIDASHAESVCGNGVCEEGETSENCPQDCGLCPSRIEVNFDKNVYYFGDDLTWRVKVYDKDNNLMPNKEFAGVRYINGIQRSSPTTYNTGSNGIFESWGIVSRSDIIGQYLINVYINQTGCEPVFDGTSFEIKPKTICGDGNCDTVYSVLKSGDYIDIPFDGKNYRIKLKDLRVSSKEEIPTTGIFDINGTIVPIERDETVSVAVSSSVIKINFFDDEYQGVRFADIAITEPCPQDCEENQTVSCTDSDGGQNWNVKGTTTGFDRYHNKQGSWTDYCYSGTTVHEYYCTHNKVDGMNHNCPYGCENGACKPVVITGLGPVTVDGLTVTINGGAKGMVGKAHWDWGDGTESDSYFLATHTYSTAGAYTVTVTATGEEGGIDTKTINVTTAPKLSAWVQSQSGRAVTINGYTGPSEVGVYKIGWNWGDGNTEESRFPASHNYSSYGTYTITVISSGIGGNTTKTLNITVEESTPTGAWGMRQANSFFTQIIDSLQKALQF